MTPAVTPSPGGAELAVTGLAVVCPVGLGAASAAAALRAGVTRLGDVEGLYTLPPEGAAAEAAEEPEALIGSVVTSIPQGTWGRDRVMALAHAALQRVLSDGEVARRELGRTALLAALPEPDAAVATWDLERAFLPELLRRSGLSGWAIAEVLAAGPVGTLRAVEAARALLSRGEADRCVVLSADSLIDPGRVGHLDEAWRIRGLRNPDGFLPGEAAAALVLEAPRAAARRKARVAGLVGPPSFADEPMPVGGERWSTGRGLAGAIRPLLRGPAGAVGRVVLCNMNGESYAAREWGVAHALLGAELPPVETLQHPADAIGEAGAAMAGVLVALACHAPPGAPPALVWVASEGGARAAAVVTPGPPAAAAAP